MARYTTITVRRDSSLNWEAANPRLALGEIGVDMTLLRFKVGNGIDRWNQLPYMNDDLYSDLDRDMREVTDRINAILETIRTNKRDADNKIGSVDSRLTVLETRQSAYERGLTAQFEEAEQALQDGLNDFAETKENLTIRMDVIAGSATEDTEILDARVDANYDTHPNLGHNIRSIHSELINQGLQLSEEIQEAAKQANDELVESAEELQQQINDNSEANLYNATNLHDEAEQRREDNQRLKLQDEFLQSEVDELNEGLQAEISQRSDADTARQDEIKTLNRALEDEAYERQNTAAGLARQANENAEANLQNTLDILEEKRQREQSDSDLQDQIDNHAGTLSTLESRITREATARESEDNALSTRINENLAKTNANEAAITQEVTAREGVQTQTEVNTLAIKKEALERKNADKTLLQTVEDEALERLNAERGLSKQVEDISEVVIENSLDILEISKQLKQEESVRADTDSELSNRISEVSVRIDDEFYERQNAERGLAKQTEDNARANIENTLGILDNAKKQSEALDREAAERLAEDDVLQSQINDVAESSLQNALNIHDEAEARRHVQDENLERFTSLSVELDEEIQARQDEGIRLSGRLSTEETTRFEADLYLYNEINEYGGALVEDDLGLARQVDQVAEANINNALNSLEADGRRKADLDREVLERVNENNNLQSQINDNASAIAESVLNIHAEAEERRKLAERLIEEIHDREREIKNLLAEVSVLYEIPLPGLYESLSSLQEQSNENAEANLQNSLNLADEIKRRMELKQALDSEIINREVAINQGVIEQRQDDLGLTRQINQTSEALVNNLLILTNEVKQRKQADDQEVLARVEHENGILEQLKILSAAISQNVLTLVDSNKIRRAVDSLERTTRLEQDDGLQEQIDLLAKALIEFVINNDDVRRRLSEIEADEGITTRATNAEFNEMLTEIYP